MKKGLTEMVFILDRSGSMAGREKDTIDGFNALIENQKKEDGEALVSVVLFNSNSKVLYDRVPLDKIEPMNERQYTVGGTTALLDAIGGAVRHMGVIHKYAREEDVPEHTIFVIATDGMENASRHFTVEEIKAKIEKRREKNGWEFVFSGANIDSFATAGAFGINPCNIADFTADAKGIGRLFGALDRKICYSRKGINAGTRKWAEELDKDRDDK